MNRQGFTQLAAFNAQEHHIVISFFESSEEVKYLNGTSNHGADQANLHLAAGCRHHVQHDTSRAQVIPHHPGPDAVQTSRAKLNVGKVFIYP